ncbi:MFS transporter [Patescibacteria group bacterium]|nr:MFS transporter [Patescibacteria group bacterium]
MFKKIFTKENDRLIFILITMFLNFLGFSVIIPILPFLVERFVPNPNELAIYMGILFSIYALCQFLSAPALGALSDLWGRRPILLISLAGSVIGYLFLALGGTYWLLLVGRIVDGLTGGNISTVYAYLADITDPAERSKYYGMVGAAGGFGFMIGPALGGILGAIHLVLPLYVAAAVTALNIVWGYFVLPESLKPEHKLEKFELSHLNPFGHLFKLFKIDILKDLFITSFIFFFAFNAIYSVTSIFAKDNFAWGTTQIGILLFVVGAVDIITQGFLIRKLIPKFGEVKLAIGGLVLCTVGILLAAFTSIYISVAFFYIGFIIMNLGDGILEPSVAGLTANAVGPKVQGRLQGASQAVQSVSRVLGPLFATWIYGTFRGLPYFSGVIFFGISILFMFLAIPSIKSHHVENAW